MAEKRSTVMYFAEALQTARRFGHAKFERELLWYDGEQRGGKEGKEGNDGEVEEGRKVEERSG